MFWNGKLSLFIYITLTTQFWQNNLGKYGVVSISQIFESQDRAFVLNKKQQQLFTLEFFSTALRIRGVAGMIVL